MVLESKYSKPLRFGCLDGESLKYLVKNGDRVDSTLPNKAHVTGRARAAMFKEKDS